MTDFFRQTAVRVTIAVVGVMLLAAGGGMVAAGATTSDRAETAAAVEREPRGDQPAVVTASSPALELDSEPEPYWRVKQQEARSGRSEEEGRLMTDREEADGREAAADDLAVASQTGSDSADSGPSNDSAGSRPSDDPAAPTGRSGAGPSAAEPDANASADASLADTTRVAKSGGQTPVAGVWGGGPEELARYLLANNASPRFTVETQTLAEYYVRFCREVGLRADVLWAQMLHETGFGAYGGDVLPVQNNYAGIGATGGGNPGHSFSTAEEGVKAHIAHMVAYAFTEDKASWTNSIVDPRYDLVDPRGGVRVLSDLDGRWAVPGNGYGERIEKHVRALNP